MISLNKSFQLSFVGVFLLVFSSTMVVLGSVQAIFGTLRWYNVSEQSHEALQEYPVYSAFDEPSKKGVIRVFIAPRPKNDTQNAYVFLQNTATARTEAIKTVTPEKAQIILQKVDDVLENNPDTSKTPQENTVFQSPVRIGVIPEKSSIPLGYSSTINTVLTGLYFRDVLWDFPLTIDNNRISPRGQMTNESVILSGRIKSLSEMAKVLVHELGHMVDIYLLRSRGTSPDPSRIYYAISWSEPTVLRPGVESSAFVSGYAATNQYEDFAEAFAMYVFHNTTFAERAEKTPALKQKYDFLRDTVFRGYFLGTNYEQSAIPSTLWDVTKIVIKTNALGEIFASMGDVIRALS